MIETTTPVAEPVRAPATVPADLLTPTEVAKRLRASRAALYEWLARGDLPSFRLGRCIRIREADVASFLERRRRVPIATRPYGRRA
jgi:excisionase family DNA binding protein